MVEAELDRTRAPAASVAIESRGQLLLARGYELETSRPVPTPARKRSTGSGRSPSSSRPRPSCSWSKAGKIGLDDEITKYLPDYPTQGNRITIRHLLTHTSGIKSYTGIGPGILE
ncbi:MAG: serine hydrolase domain-containing protein [Gemmatimonadales bacterium]